MRDEMRRLERRKETWVEIVLYFVFSIGMHWVASKVLFHCMACGMGILNRRVKSIECA
jgi:hypothetical protein